MSEDNVNEDNVSEDNVGEDIGPLLREWDEGSDSGSIRKVVGSDGREKIQIRVQFGMLQLEADGRRVDDLALNEAEMQALALLFAAEKDGESVDHAALDKACEERYWIYKEDLSAAFPALLEQGFIEGDDNGYRLTDEGRPKAEYCNKA